MKERNGNYNSTKKRVLEIFQDQEWLDVLTIAGKAGIRPVRQAYMYLAHLDPLDDGSTPSKRAEGKGLTVNGLTG